MRKTSAIAIFILLSACASRSPADMADAANNDDSGYTVRDHQRGGVGGNGNIWSEVLRTALQTGMSFAHH